MKKMIAKLCSGAGDTIIETLCAILIIALSTGFLVAAVATSAKLNRAASEHSAARTAAMNAAEFQAAGDLSGTATVTITFDSDASGTKNVQVDLYGAADGKFSTYRKGG